MSNPHCWYHPQINFIRLAKKMATTIQFLGKYTIHCSIVKINGEGLDSLTPEEKRIYASFRFNKRKKEWLAGRIGGKESIIHFLGQKGIHVASNRIGILSRPSRAPYVVIDNEEAANLNISISHSNELAVAAVSGDGIIGLGVDIEIVEDRSASFSRVAFTLKEREYLEKSTVREFPLLSTMAYTLKEAVTKALGIGLSVNTHDVEVFYADSKFPENWNGMKTCPAKELNIWNVCLHNEANARLKELGGGQLLLGTSLLSDLLLSEADMLPTGNMYAVGFACAIE